MYEHPSRGLGHFGDFDCGLDRLNPFVVMPCVGPRLDRISSVVQDYEQCHRERPGDVAIIAPGEAASDLFFFEVILEPADHAP
jgi:hypothetical protein